MPPPPRVVIDHVDDEVEEEYEEEEFEQPVYYEIGCVFFTVAIGRIHRGLIFIII